MCSLVQSHVSCRRLFAPLRFLLRGHVTWFVSVVVAVLARHAVGMESSTSHFDEEIDGTAEPHSPGHSVPFRELPNPTRSEYFQGKNRRRKATNEKRNAMWTLFLCDSD